MRVHHIALRTRDVPRLQSFYREVLGFTPVARRDEGAPSVWLAMGDAVLMLECVECNDEPAPPVGTRELVAFAVDDLTPWRARLERAGVTIQDATAFTLYLRDPDGRRVGLSTYAFDRA
jgi:catechol 2,3-dioxygenase-like lactoylglutathione lyase family enzyme